MDGVAHRAGTFQITERGKVTVCRQEKILVAADEFFPEIAPVVFPHTDSIGPDRIILGQVDVGQEDHTVLRML